MLAAALLWSLGGIFIKLVPWNPLSITGARGLLGGIVVFIYLRMKKIPLAINKDTIKIAVSLACVCATFVTANKLTTAANAIVIQYCAPVYVLLYVAFVQKKKLKPLDIAVVPITILGSRSALSAKSAKVRWRATSLRWYPACSLRQCSSSARA